MGDWDEAKVRTLLQSLGDFCALFWKRAARGSDSAAVESAVSDLVMALDEFDLGPIEIECDMIDMTIAEYLKLSDTTVKFAGVEADNYAYVVILIVRKLLEEMADICDGDWPPRYVDESVAAENWGAICKRLGPKILSQEIVEKLAALVEQELQQRPPERKCHKVYKARQPLRSAKAKRRLALYRRPAKALRGGRPIDVLDFVGGEPRDRHVTKIGGLPYRPARLKWPIDENGTSLSFVAQICFADSHELVGDLPGDVMLIFTADEDQATSGFMFFEWYPLGISRLVEAAQIPRAAWEIAPCYALPRRQPESGPGHKGSTFGHEGAKIGGEPVWLQGGQSIQGRFLAALARPKFLTPADLPAGWEETRVTGAYDETHEFSPGDGGIFNFFHAGKGKVNLTFQCY